VRDSDNDQLVTPERMNQQQLDGSVERSNKLTT
jgi:hypothetical protein